MKNPVRILALSAVALVAASALAHGRLEASVPAQGATLAASPPELRFRFNEPVEAAMSGVRLTGPGDREVPLGKVQADKDDVRTLVVSVPRLDAGDYRARWATAGHDGHRVGGEVRFTVK